MYFARWRSVQPQCNISNGTWNTFARLRNMWRCLYFLQGLARPVYVGSIALKKSCVLSDASGEHWRDYERDSVAPPTLPGRLQRHQINRESAADGDCPQNDHASSLNLSNHMPNNGVAQTMPNDYYAVWPRSTLMVAPRQMAPRVDSLEGKTLAFCWDYVFRGNEIWEFLKAEFSRRCESIKFVDPDTFGSTHGSDEQAVLASLPAKLRSLKVDALLSGMGC
jgi:hypothetical protein